MIKTRTNSYFALKTLSEIRDCRDIILQTENTGANFDNGQKCYLCEVITANSYRNEPNEKVLMFEICKLNEEKRKLEKKIQRLEKRLEEVYDK